MKETDSPNGSINAASERFMAVCKERDQLRAELAEATRKLRDANEGWDAANRVSEEIAHRLSGELTELRVANDALTKRLEDKERELKTMTAMWSGLLSFIAEIREVHPTINEQVRGHREIKRLASPPQPVSAAEVAGNSTEEADAIGHRGRPCGRCEHAAPPAGIEPPPTWKHKFVKSGFVNEHGCAEIIGVGAGFIKCGQPENHPDHIEQRPTGEAHQFMCRFASSHPAGCSKACLCEWCDKMQWQCTGAKPAAPAPDPAPGPTVCLAHLPSDDGGWNDSTRANYERDYGAAPPCTCPAAPASAQGTGAGDYKLRWLQKLDDRMNALYEEFVAQRKDDSELGRRIAALESCAGESWQIGKPAPFVPHRPAPPQPAPVERQHAFECDHDNDCGGNSVFCRCKHCGGKPRSAAVHGIGEGK